MRHHLLAIIATSMMLTACAGARQSGWDDIDYTRLARQNAARENDSNYTPPATVLGCSDDDLYNCNN